MKLCANPGDFSAEAVALATFFSNNPDEWAKFDSAREGVALSGLADGEYVVTDGDGTTSFADVEQYVTNMTLFNTLTAEMDRNGDFLQDLDNSGQLDQAEFEAALQQLETDNENFEGLQQTLQFAIDSDLMNEPDNRSTLAQIGDSIYTISSLNPGSPTNIHRAITEPGDLLNDYVSFGQGAGNTVVAFGQLAYDVSVMSPLAPGFYFEAWRVDGDMDQHRGVQMARAVPAIVESVASLSPVTPQFWSELDEVRQTGTWDNHGGVTLIEASIDFETFLSDPAEWAGQFAPEVLITIATGGGGSIAKIGTTATRATNAARRAATTARRILPTAADLTDLRRIMSQKLDELAVEITNGRATALSPLTRANARGGRPPRVPSRSDSDYSLNSSNSREGDELASPELLQSVGERRQIQFAEPGSEEMRYLDYMGAEANVGGPNMDHILLRGTPSKAALLEEFLHGTQHRLGIIKRLGVSGAESHVKDFMIRHQRMLGLSDEDVRRLTILKEAGL